MMHKANGSLAIWSQNTIKQQIEPKIVLASFLLNIFNGYRTKSFVFALFISKLANDLFTKKKIRLF